MSTETPPNPYFNNINFNPSFFKVLSVAYLTEAIANSKYLKLIGGTISGFLGIGRTARVELDVNGKAVINNDLTAPPAVGQFGGNGTKLILFDGNATEAPYAIGIDTSTLWYGTNTAGSHKFYTGTTERMRIKNDGYVGIGASDPLSRLTINATPGQVGTGGTIFGLTPLTITNPNPTSGSTLNDPKPVLNLCRDGTGAASFASRATFNLCRYENSGVNSRTRLDIGLTHADNFTETNVMSIRSDGNVGIGITNPSAKLYVNGSTITLGTLTTKNGSYELFIDSPTSTTPASIQTIQQGVGYNQNLTLQAIAGNVGIGTNNPGSYKLNVNGTTYLNGDVETSGSINLTTANKVLNFGSRVENYLIKLYGDAYGFGINGGVLRYNSDENHVFYCTAIERMRITGSGNVGIGTNNPGSYKLSVVGNTNVAGILSANNINTSGTVNVAFGDITVNEGNIFLYGKTINYTSKTNSGGTVKNGYFVNTSDNYRNSLILLAASHNSTSYTYWNGRISTNQNGAILDIALFNGVTFATETFIEQGTGKYWIYMYPTVSYNTSVGLLVKIIG